MSLSRHGWFFRLAVASMSATLCVTVLALLFGAHLVLKSGVDKGDVVALISISFVFGGVMTAMLAFVNMFVGAFYDDDDTSESVLITMCAMTLVVALIIAGTALKIWFAVAY